MQRETLFRAKRDEKGHLYLEDPHTGITSRMDKRFWQRIAKRWERGSEFLGGFDQNLTVKEIKNRVDTIAKKIKEGLEKWEEKK